PDALARGGPTLHRSRRMTLESTVRIPSDAPAVELTSLRRDYVVRSAVPGARRRRRQVVRAVDEITLRIERGEAVGFVGANGAGKSTTIKMLTGILQPSAGRVRVLGREPVPERRRL